MKRVLLILALLLIIGASFWTGTALGTGAHYEGSGYFPTSDLNWKFFGTESDAGGSYTTPAWNAVAPWRNNTDLNLTQVYGVTWDVQISVLHYGASGWNGQTYICATNGECDNTSALNNTYSYAITGINQHYLADDNATARHNTIGHELGHPWSLAHQGYHTSSMYQVQTTVTSPNARDRGNVNTRY